MKRKDLLSIRDLKKQDILALMESAKQMKTAVQHPSKREFLHLNQAMITLFYENSTRTKASFTLAGKYLGMHTTDLAVSTSSVQKGECLLDTGKTLDQMGIQVVVVRHNHTGAPHLLAENMGAHVINAGDGSNEHPTQALLDLFTMLEQRGSVEGKKVAIVGDIAHSRVARSNFFCLQEMGAHVVFAGPETLLGGVHQLGAKTTTDVREAVADADVVMALRIQLERQKANNFPSLAEYQEFFGITEDLMRYAKKDALIMHPGPVNRGVELTNSLVDGQSSVILQQVQNGVAVRMAILNSLLEGEA